MSPRRRRSARIASSSKRVKASPTPQLTSLTECDEFADEDNTTIQSLNAVMSSPMPDPKTPSAATPFRLPLSEMHPSKVHPTTAPPSDGLELGFVDIDYSQKPNAQISAAMQKTPSKTTLPTSAFTFRQVRPSSEYELGPEAREMMEDLREEAARIKADLLAQKEQEEAEVGDGRKIARAKGKAGRFSAAHMAEFKKMDSIANHPSVMRVNAERSATTRVGIKRSPSKADLDEPELTHPKTLPPRLGPRSFEKPRVEPESPSKRIRQRFEDDVSTIRPVSRDASFIPRPKSSGNDSIRSGISRSHTYGSLMTPTKASLARTNGSTTTLVKSPSKPELRSILKSPSRPDISSSVKSQTSKVFGGLKKSATSNNLNAVSSVPTRVQTPGRFGRVKSILKQFTGPKPITSIPRSTTSLSKTPVKFDTSDNELPPAPLTTPGRKHGRHVNFTPLAKRAAAAQNSPSPVKSSIPRSKTLPKLNLIQYPSVEKTLKEQKSVERIEYPDLSSYGDESEIEVQDNQPDAPPQSIPGTFTFRSDHTIRFGSSSPNGFGGNTGQASLRHVRESGMTSFHMPGSFPRPSEGSPNKENNDPATGRGIPHGMSNKKRHRASWDDEEEDEGGKRGAKKLRKDPPPLEGHALVAPRLAGNMSPPKRLNRPSGTPSPKKNASGLSLSRLNMLARPKVRK